jgi:hypothetical protein
MAHDAFHATAHPPRAYSAKTRSRADGTATHYLEISAAIVFLLAAALYVTSLTGGGAFPRDIMNFVAGRDFLNVWMYGRAAFESDPGRFYNVDIYNAALRALLGGAYPGQTWSYPPALFLIAWPFGFLNYLPALALFTLGGISFFVWAARRAIDDRSQLAILVISPAAILCLISGQFSFFGAGLLILIFLSLDKRPLLAGALIGLFVIKPQLALFFPVILIASGRWRVFSAAAISAAAIALVTAAIFGPQIWIDYVKVGLPSQNLVLVEPYRLGAPLMPTIFMNARWLGADYATAMAVQLCFTALAVALLVFAYRAHKDADPWLLAALFLACSVFGSPYLMSYDLLPLTFAAILLRATGRLDAQGQRFAALVYWLPLIQFTLGQFYLPGASLIAPAFALYLVALLRGRAGAPLTAS